MSTKREQLTVDQEIEKLIKKLCGEFQTRLARIIERNTKRVLREQAVQLKTATRSTKPVTKPVAKPVTKVHKLKLIQI